MLSREIYKLFKSNVNVERERLLLNIILKETRTKVLSCEFCELFKSTYFPEDLTASFETAVGRRFFN